MRPVLKSAAVLSLAVGALLIGPLARPAAADTGSAGAGSGGGTVSVGVGSGSGSGGSGGGSSGGGRRRRWRRRFAMDLHLHLSGAQQPGRFPERRPDARGLVLGHL